VTRKERNLAVRTLEKLGMKLDSCDNGEEGMKFDKGTVGRKEWVLTIETVDRKIGN
jgi:hypothetical protein